jgi:hypothetical protein
LIDVKASTFQDLLFSISSPAHQEEMQHERCGEYAHQKNDPAATASRDGAACRQHNL